MSFMGMGPWWFDLAVCEHCTSNGKGAAHLSRELPDSLSQSSRCAFAGEFPGVKLLGWGSQLALDACRAGSCAGQGCKGVSHQAGKQGLPQAHTACCQPDSAILDKVAGLLKLKRRLADA